ncbi:MAG: hypothetical protein IV092_10585 [Burkholderiaceae bacterium]|nr:hypothetical protein [Burkholderiaceae bacterium]
MNKFLTLAATLPLVVGCAATQTKGLEHQAHHPDGAASAAVAKPMPGMGGDMAVKMKAMQEMHQKMMAARTAEERQALMAEHMKAMQGGMGMMKGMSGGAAMGKEMPADPQRRMQTMEQRMDMMQMMMEMMMDRMPAGPAPTSSGK